MKGVRFPIVVKRGSSEVKIYRDRKPEGTYYRVAYYLGSKRHRLNFSDVREATDEAQAKASQLSRGDMDAVQLSGKRLAKPALALQNAMAMRWSTFRPDSKTW
jgi:hypothetical protein